MLILGSHVVTYVDKKYKRVSAESAYLTPDVLARKNLAVAINATATRILFDKTRSSRPKAVGVEFGREQGGRTWRAYAKKEVVVSYVAVAFLPKLQLTPPFDNRGGAVHSPHVRLLNLVIYWNCSY